MMADIEPSPMIPFYKGFVGSIEPLNKGFVITGTFNRLDDNELEITELPIGKWTKDYKTFLEELTKENEVSEIREYHKENRVHFIIQVPKLEEMSDSDIIKKFKL